MDPTTYLYTNRKQREHSNFLLWLFDCYFCIHLSLVTSGLFCVYYKKKVKLTGLLICDDDDDVWYPCSQVAMCPV